MTQTADDILARAWRTLRVDRANEASLLVTLSRPEAMNALDSVMMGELRDLFEAIDANPDAARCIVLTGAGERAFCAGADLKERLDMSDEAWRRQHAVLEAAVRAIAACPVPIIAAVNGAALGGGCELVLLADFAYASPSARFGFPETSRGVIPGAGGTQTLPRAVGMARAKQLILTGRVFTAEDALAWGLVLEVVSGGETAVSRALATARGIEANAPVAVRAAKRAMRLAKADFEAGYAAELAAYELTVGTEDRREGVRAFVEKRPPRFKGR